MVSLSYFVHLHNLDNYLLLTSNSVSEALLPSQLQTHASTSLVRDDELSI